MSRRNSECLVSPDDTVQLAEPSASESQALNKPPGDLEAKPGSCHSSLTLSRPASEDMRIPESPNLRSEPAHPEEELTPFTIESKGKGPEKYQKTRSSTSIALQLPHETSEALNYPTIVHRPNLHARPHILSVQEQLAPSNINSDQEQRAQDSTNPSTNNDSSVTSLKEGSTEPTSLGSHFPSSYSAESKNRGSKPIFQGQNAPTEVDSYEKPLFSIQEAPHIISPTIVTVETTANAKIFFETHFDSLLSIQSSPRSIRQKELEEWLKAESLTSDQRQQARQLWAKQESEQLRQTRVLKSRSNGMSGRFGVAIAGFEVVRVLGKGSFGVVRLVREKSEPAGDLIAQDPLLNDASTRRQTPREEFLGLRIAAFEAFRSTLEGQKSSQRKESKKPKKEVYAMKVIRKSDMLRSSQEGHLRAERDFLVASERSRWVVPLIASFQDHNHLYLVMEYMVGGDFLGLLFRKDILKEKKARWYVAEMILCVEEAHRLRWIHRDVKPDNFLISASGHLKISDFGLAFDGHWTHDQGYFNGHRQSLMEKLGIRVEGDSIDKKEGASIAAGMRLANVLTGRKDHHDQDQIDGPNDSEEIPQRRNRKLARSVVGTSQYMAPEVIRGELYDGRCDWWSIGIILYEVSKPCCLSR